MRKQTVLWTALPTGIAGSPGAERLRLSVLVSPRLETNEGLPKPTLAQFPDFVDWPGRAPAFSVKFDNGLVLAADIVSPAPSAAQWGALFSSSTYVRPYSFPDLHERRVHSFPTKHVLDYIKQKYTAFAANNPDEHPPLKDLTGLVRDLGYLNRQPGTLSHNLGAGALADVKALPPGPANPATDFLQLKNFHERPGSLQIVPVTVPEIDFHQMVALMGDYPEVMRRVGLIYDLELPLDQGIPAFGAVSVVPDWQATPGTVNLTPATAYQISGSRFQAAPRGAAPEQQGGLLRLGDADGYGVVQVDADGAGLKLLDFVQSLIRGQRHRTADTPEQYAVPSLRSHGLSLVRTGRAYNLHTGLGEVKARNDAAVGGGAVTLYAEDVTRGYRVDIWDSRSEVWHSLCRRVGSYQFLNTGESFTHEDEGIVTMGVTSVADGSSPDLYLHESMLRWEGWSLVAPRPGRVITPQDQVAASTHSASTEFKLQVNFKAAPGSLPKLRYGASYRMRARAVDLAGNSVPLDPAAAPDPVTDTPVVQYGRYEPVNSPNLVLRKDVTPGEALERLVIRSNYNAPAGGENERHVAPPRVAQLTAEAHGQFDAGSGLDKGAYATITGRDASYDPSGIHPEAQLALPYLPDPIGRGAALLGLPGAAAGSTTRVPFPTGAWPDWLPFRLRIAEGSGAPSWNAVDRVLTVLLPKAEIRRVRLSSHFENGDIPQMGLWGWLAETGLPAAKIDQLKALALQGRHWMQTPYRTLTLVHAVQQPLLEPVFSKLTPARGLGETFATLSDTMPISGRSTLKVDVTATWQEPVDALTEPEWKYIAGKADAFEVPVKYGDTVAAISHRHEFGDTKYRKVSYSATATTRFAEYFAVAASASVTLTGTAAVNLGQPLVVSGSEKVLSIDSATEYEREKDYTVDYPAGTIARTATGAIADGAAVKVSFSHYPGPITRESPAPVEVDVLNSARPAAPKVLYIVPTWGWEQESFDGGVAVKRQGGGLRIYMERPWFSSGDGELLGAVLWPGPSRLVTRVLVSRPPDKLKPYVTQWGMDPIWASGVTHALPALNHFVSAVDKGTGLTLEEAPGATFHVAGHAVGYDKERKLWYCDMELDAGRSYYPFVRLALVRYQPKSVAGAHLSRVVLADFAQLAPDRVATITSDPGDPAYLQVTLCGPGYRESAAAKAPSEVEVTVETRRPEIEGELGWVPVPNGTFPLAVVEATGPEISWAGQVTVGQPRGAQPCRLVIKEYERFRVDGAGTNFAAGFVALPRTERRLVFAAAVEI